MTLRYFVVKGEEGEHMWVLEIGTSHVGIGGAKISSRKIHNVNVDNLDQIIEENLAILASQIDWGNLLSDNDPPYLNNFLPAGENVEIGSNVSFTLKEQLPAAGIDISSIKVFFNNGAVEFDISNDIRISGDPYEYTIEWEPDDRIYSRYS
jgi:hypothetical protein